jgi:predicted nucleic acid-binding protein
VLIVDSCVLIHLSRIGKLDLLKVHECCTTDDVYKETVIEGKRGKSLISDAFEKWLTRKAVDTNVAFKIAQKEGIEVADATLILLAEQIHGTILSNDKDLILLARSRGISYLWLTSFLLKLCKDKKMKKEEALKIFYDLVQSGLRIEAKIYVILEKKLSIEY